MKYTVVIDGKPQGPFALEQLREMNIQPGTFIRKPGMDDYKEAHELSELRDLFGFSHQQTLPQYFASFDQRLLATVIDYFFITIAYVLLILCTYLFIRGQAQRILAATSGLPLIYVAKLIYSSVEEASIRQAGIGKRLLNIRVTDLGGNRLSLQKAFVRNVSKLVSTATLCIGYLYSFLNKKQQCLHDLLAGTLVVKDRLL